MSGYQRRDHGGGSRYAGNRYCNKIFSFVHFSLLYMAINLASHQGRILVQGIISNCRLIDGVRIGFSVYTVGYSNFIYFIIDQVMPTMAQTAGGMEVVVNPEDTDHPTPGQMYGFCLLCYISWRF